MVAFHNGESGGKLQTAINRITDAKGRFASHSLGALRIPQNDLMSLP